MTTDCVGCQAQVIRDGCDLFTPDLTDPLFPLETT